MAEIKIDLDAEKASGKGITYGTVVERVRAFMHKKPQFNLSEVSELNVGAEANVVLLREVASLNVVFARRSK